VGLRWGVVSAITLVGIELAHRDTVRSAQANELHIIIQVQRC
jgi:hypothetical protein